jgi:hypothetical protein
VAGEGTGDDSTAVPAGSAATPPASTGAGGATSFACQSDGAGQGCAAGAALALSGRTDTTFQFAFTVPPSTTSATQTAALIEGRQWLFQGASAAGAACTLQFDPTDPEVDVLVVDGSGCDDVLFGGDTSVDPSLLAGTYKTSP